MVGSFSMAALPTHVGAVADGSADGLGGLLSFTVRPVHPDGGQELPVSGQRLGSSCVTVSQCRWWRWRSPHPPAGGRHGASTTSPGPPPRPPLGAPPPARRQRNPTALGSPAREPPSR